MKRFVLNTHTTYSCQGLLKFLWKEESVVAKRCVHYSRASDKAIQLSVKKAKLIANVEANVYVCTHLSLISSFFFQTKTIVPTCFWPLSKQLSFPTASVQDIFSLLYSKWNYIQVKTHKTKNTINFSDHTNYPKCQWTFHIWILKLLQHNVSYLLHSLRQNDTNEYYEKGKKNTK